MRFTVRENRMKKLSLVTLCLILVLRAYAAVASEEGLKKVSLIPQWMPQAQFAGYMVARDKGFYREVGLDLNLLHGGPGKSPFDYLSSGHATFGVQWLSVGIQQKASGVPVVNLAQIVQQSALMIVAKKDSGILSPKDLQGRKVGLWEGHFYLPALLFFQRLNVSVQIVPNYSSVDLFLKGGLDAMSAMWYNEYHQIINSGLDQDELTTFFFRDFGVDFPEDGLYCMEKTFEEDPRTCRAFVEASLKGWLYAFSHKDEAVDIVMNHCTAGGVVTNKPHQRWMLARMEDLILPKGDRSALGKLKLEAYESVCRALRKFSLIQDVPPFDSFYKGEK
jgi:NitT/TauT family transport system substrate-binding protein